VLKGHCEVVDLRNKSSGRKRKEQSEGGLENVSSSRRSRKTRKFLLLPVRTPSAFLQAFGLPAAEMRGPDRKKREDKKRQRKEANTAKSRVLGLRERL
jgi:hypothetical protein